MSAPSPLIASRIFGTAARVEAIAALLRPAHDAARGHANLPAALASGAAAQVRLSGPLADGSRFAGAGAVADVPTVVHAGATEAVASAGATEAVATGARGVAPAGSATIGLALPVPVVAAEPVQIGALGRALAAALPAAAASATTTLTLNTLGAAARDPEQFAPALARAIAVSGVSYEAHLNDWLNGSRSVDDLRSEARALVHSLPTPARTSAPAPPVSETAAAVTAAQQITATQLRCIETGELRFAFQAWPGQACEMILRPNDQREREQGQDHTAANTEGDGTLTLHMPHLGEVRARLRTRGSEVQVTLHAATGAAVRQFNAATTALSSALGVAGLKLVSVVVHESA